MSLQVKELENDESNKKCCKDIVVTPARRSIKRVYKEVHVEHTANKPIMETILKQVEEWHSIIGEPMYKCCLILSLDVMKDDHSNTEFLVVSQRSLLSVDLLLEHNEENSDKNWSKIFNKEHSLP